MNRMFNIMFCVPLVYGLSSCTQIKQKTNHDSHINVVSEGKGNEQEGKAKQTKTTSIEKDHRKHIGLNQEDLRQYGPEQQDYIKEVYDKYFKLESTNGFSYMLEHYNYRNSSMNTRREEFENVDLRINNGYYVAKWNENKDENVFGYLILLVKNSNFWPEIKNSYEIQNDYYGLDYHGVFHMKANDEIRILKGHNTLFATKVNKEIRAIVISKITFCGYYFDKGVFLKQNIWGKYITVENVLEQYSVESSSKGERYKHNKMFLPSEIKATTTEYERNMLDRIDVESKVKEARISDLAKDKENNVWRFCKLNGNKGNEKRYSYQMPINLCEYNDLSSHVLLRDVPTENTGETTAYGVYVEAPYMGLRRLWGGEFYLNYDAKDVPMIISKQTKKEWLYYFNAFVEQEERYNLPQENIFDHDPGLVE